MEDPVRGTARVLHAAQRPDDALMKSTEIELSVVAEGLEATSARFSLGRGPNVAEQVMSGVKGSLTAEQDVALRDTKSKVAGKEADLARLAVQFQNGEIDQDELFRRQNELMDQG